MAEVDGLNAGYARALLDEYLKNPEAVSAEWRTLFENDSELLVQHPSVARLLEVLRAADNGERAAVAEAPPPAPGPAVDETLLGGVAAAMALVKAYRTHGHLAARLDPLGSEPVGDPALEPERLVPPLTPELQQRIPARLLRVYFPGETLADVLPQLQETYSGTSAYEIEHISDHQERVWLRQAIESGSYRTPLPPEQKRRLLTRLTEVEGFERYLLRSFLGQKSFSIEGLDVLVPMLDLAVELAAEDGAHQVVIGMAHRGRLNVLAHVLGRPYGSILREFEGERTLAALSAQPSGSSGDVKYHLGDEGRRKAPSGDVTVSLAANPSHLEAVDPVVEGLTRSEQTDRSTRDGAYDARVALPLLIHGDASFPGQGVVAETLNLQGLGGYSTGGTLHVIANNQVGFTTEPEDGRSTRYSSDLAKGFDVPIVHVNADDPEAAVSAIRLALAFRRRFGHDVVIDLVGYRRHGHNEGDEPAYTQPLMAERIKEHPTVREQYAARLVAEGAITQEEADGLVSAVEQNLKQAHETLKASLGASLPPPREGTPPTNGSDVITSVLPDTLRGLNDELLKTPDHFTVHPKLARQLQRRHEAIDQGRIDWGHAEALALGSLIVEGIPIRLTGQDTERGTFSHRHLVLHDPGSGEQYTPMTSLAGAQASFEVYNSPLSEYATLGFEYGYSVGAPEALVIWEAQYGDFVNGAQIIVDQFLVSGLSKWAQTSRLTLFLPHGYEGNGPEHSSARLERFLQLAAQENIRIVNPSTAAQYFHVIRRQALDPNARPLIVMTPKGLLRLKEAASSLEQLSDGRFQPVLDDEVDHTQVRRLVLSSGKLYYDLAGHEDRRSHPEIALARLEQLYPFPVRPAAELVASYPALEEVVWAQEEPQNMGAWRAIRHRLEEAIGGRVPLRYAGRPWRASPSEGYPTAHLQEQERIVKAVLTPPNPPTS